MKVLIVDDNALVCWALEKMLAKQGISAHGVDTGDKGMSEVRRMPYELIFLDIHLPDANGLDLLEEIRRISPDSKVVMISSDCVESNVQRAMAGGALRFLEKPFRPSEITEVLDEVRRHPPSSLPASERGEAIPGRTS